MQDIDEQLTSLIHSWFSDIRGQISAGKSGLFGGEHRLHERERILLIIGRDGQIVQKQLSELLMVSPQSMSEALSKLENDGYITRTKNSRDKRETIVSLTPEGKLHSDRLAQRMSNHAHSLLNPLSDEEKKTLYSLLKSLQAGRASKQSRKGGNNMAFEKIYEYAAEKQPLCLKNDAISDELFEEYGVNRGLRDINGKGVLTGLTKISKIVSFKDGKPCDGELWYRGYNVRTLIEGLSGGFGFEKIAYLLIFGELPTGEQLDEFKGILADACVIPSNFTRDVIMKAPSKDIMNSMTKSILTLSSYDENLSSNDIGNCIRQCLQLVAEFPMLAVYGYHAYNHYENDGSMYIHRPAAGLSTAENFLRMLRPDMKYTALEARVLDIVLILHMEHGGGNNSTFTTRVVTSAGSDTYSAIAAAMSSLKGPRHGGANLKVMQMMQDIRTHVSDPTDKDEVGVYLSKLLDGEVFDKKGLIYGMGHAVYSISDPRERALKSYVEKLAKAKDRTQDMALYSNIEELAPKLIAQKRRIYKGVSPNVDFYSGFVYDMLGIPQELYTPLFAIARVVGWSAHRIEELVGSGKIIRPAYKSVMDEIG